VVQIARDVLAGEHDLLDAAIKLSSLLSTLDPDWDDPDYHILALVSSEIMELPIGSERSNWDPAALLRKQPEVERALAWAEAIGGLGACRNLIQRFAS
jgi:hypothetical protein